MAAMSIGGRKQSFANTISMCGAAPFALTASMSNSCCPFSMPAMSFRFASSTMGRNALTRSSTAATKSLEEHRESYCDAARVQIEANYCPPWKWICLLRVANWRSARSGFYGLRDYLHLLHAGHCFVNFEFSGTSNAPTMQPKFELKKYLSKVKINLFWT